MSSETLRISGLFFVAAALRFAWVGSCAAREPCSDGQLRVLAASCLILSLFCGFMGYTVLVQLDRRTTGKTTREE